MSVLDSPDSLKLSRSTAWLGNWVERHGKLWKKWGDWETRLLLPDLVDIPIRTPIYIAGLARSGSTMLLELLASHPDTASHRYRDFPFLFTPYWWNTLTRFLPRDKTPRERAHGDGILVTGDSPEAMEEVLWRAFFSHLHDPAQSQMLDSHTHHPAFERFYLAHIKKLLFVRKKKRYLSKGNYNLSRLAYLHRLFPDAVFILPIREPAAHIASLMRQHARFCAAGQRDARIARHMAQLGHFEFGPGRRPVHTGDEEAQQAILAAWKNNDELLGWALYWDAMYRMAFRELARDPALQAATLVVRFEALCEDPETTIRALFAHARLSLKNDELARLSARIHPPEPVALDTASRALIERITADTAHLFGYPRPYPSQTI